MTDTHLSERYRNVQDWGFVSDYFKVDSYEQKQECFDLLYIPRVWDAKLRCAKKIAKGGYRNPEHKAIVTAVVMDILNTVLHYLHDQEIDTRLLTCWKEDAYILYRMEKRKLSCRPVESPVFQAIETLCEVLQGLHARGELFVKEWGVDAEKLGFIEHYFNNFRRAYLAQEAK